MQSSAIMFNFWQPPLIALEILNLPEPSMPAKSVFKCPISKKGDLWVLFPIANTDIFGMVTNLMFNPKVYMFNDMGMRLKNHLADKMDL